MTAMRTTAGPGPTGDADVDALLADVAGACSVRPNGTADGRAGSAEGNANGSAAGSADKHAGSCDDDLTTRLQAFTVAHRRLADRLATPPEAPQPQPGQPGA